MFEAEVRSRALADKRSLSRYYYAGNIYLVQNFMFIRVYSEHENVRQFTRGDLIWGPGF